MLGKAFAEFEQGQRKPEVSMAPLIDMVFLLLIFFVVTTTFTKEAGIKIEKSKAETSQSLNRDLFLIAIDKKGNYWHEKSKRGLKEVVALSKAAHIKNSKLNVVIVPDKKGEVDPLIVLMDKLRAQNITRFSLGTEMTDPETPAQTR